MKPMYLTEICEKIGTTSQEKALITKVANSINDIDNNTLVFYLNRVVELDIDKFNTLKNCYIITDRSLLTSENVDLNKFIFVEDCVKAYYEFINAYRNQFQLPIVAITGTCGKTTTKEMIKQILENDYNVKATIGNRNSLSFNHEYIFSIDDKTEYGVFETAITSPGNLIYGCNIFKPSIGVITNIGIDHLNGCRTLDNYIRTKSEMLAGLQYKGTLIINNDCENTKKINMKPFKGKIITFGINNDSDYKASNIKFKDLGMEFTLNCNKGKYQVYVPGIGIHNVYNALAALSALSTLGLYLPLCINYLKNVKFIRSHTEVLKGKNGSTIIDDTWSSNPTSVFAAFDTLKEYEKGKVKIVVIGRISYLGEFATKYYEEIGRKFYEDGFDFIFTTDSFSKQIAKSAIKHGFNPAYHIHCKNNEELKSKLGSLLDKNTIVLFKTSMLDQSITSVIKQLIDN
ncbi:MAG TPA: UDP-N-acetylmuramoyl-tripeptide--D-alanyl-D-alanine ligase [Acholeplasmataceae bacterium]|nr:UDP-N-acetylmuramoyl-tripeptide--D-alanyl-D-alanine ligase [Acholeplasmataceae bacterium]